MLGDGKLGKALKVSAHHFSAQARQKIEAAGGTVTLLAGAAPVEKGWTAAFIELSYDSGGPFAFKQSTAVRITPDTLPHAGFDPKTDIRFIWTFELNILGSNGWERSDLHALLDLVESGRLNPPVEQVYSLADAPAAFRALEDRSAFGKLIVKP